MELKNFCDKKILVHFYSGQLSSGHPTYIVVPRLAAASQEDVDGDLLCQILKLTDGEFCHGTFILFTFKGMSQMSRACANHTCHWILLRNKVYLEDRRRRMSEHGYSLSCELTMEDFVSRNPQLGLTAEKLRSMLA